MNKTQFFILFFNLLGGAIFYSKLSGQLILVPEATIPVQIDGIIGEDEWQDAISDTSISNLVYTNPEGGGSIQEASVSLKWNADFLYLLFQVQDDALFVDSTDGDSLVINTFDDDSVEVYLDVNNTNSGILNRPEGRFQYRFIPLENGEIESFPDDMPIRDIVFAHQGTKAYVMEIALPWDTLKVDDPRVGRVMGFLAGLNDDDDGGEREAQYFWHADDASAWQDASQWGDIQLTGAKNPPPPPPVDAPEAPLVDVFTLDGPVWISWDQAEGFIYQLRHSQDLSIWTNDTRSLLTTGSTHFFQVTAEDIALRRFFQVEVTPEPEI